MRYKPQVGPISMDDRGSLPAGGGAYHMRVEVPTKLLPAVLENLLALHDTMHTRFDMNTPNWRKYCEDARRRARRAMDRVHKAWQEGSGIFMYVRLLVVKGCTRSRILSRVSPPPRTIGTSASRISSTAAWATSTRTPCAAAPPWGRCRTRSRRCSRTSSARGPTATSPRCVMRDLSPGWSVGLPL